MNELFRQQSISDSREQGLDLKRPRYLVLPPPTSFFISLSFASLVMFVRAFFFFLTFGPHGVSLR